MAAGKPRSILVNRKGQEPLIVDNIPATAKITFAKANPAEKGYGDNPMALRIYTRHGNLRCAPARCVLCGQDGNFLGRGIREGRCAF